MHGIARERADPGADELGGGHDVLDRPAADRDVCRVPVLMVRGAGTRDRERVVVAVVPERLLLGDGAQAARDLPLLAALGGERVRCAYEPVAAGACEAVAPASVAANEVAGCAAPTGVVVAGCTGAWTGGAIHAWSMATRETAVSRLTSP